MGVPVLVYRVAIPVLVGVKLHPGIFSLWAGLRVSLFSPLSAVIFSFDTANLCARLASVSPRCTVYTITAQSSSTSLVLVVYADGVGAGKALEGASEGPGTPVSMNCLALKAKATKISPRTRLRITNNMPACDRETCFSKRVGIGRGIGF